MSFLTAVLLCACSPAADNEGGGRQFRYEERAYFLSCEVIRDDRLEPVLGDVQFEDRSLVIRPVAGIERGEALAARWPECAPASEPPPWVLAVTRLKEGIPDLEPYRDALINERPTE